MKDFIIPTSKEAWSDRDMGTPASKSTTMVTLTIDGFEVTVPEGTSIMRAAMESGTQIPKLCATDMVNAFGSCRLCLVEIEGRAGTPASCTTPAISDLLKEELMKWAIPADLENPRMLSTWFFIKAIRGLITMAVPSIIKAGNW